MTKILAGVSTALLLVVAATPPVYADEASTTTRVLQGWQALLANLPTLNTPYATPKCLLPYPVCKLAFAGTALLSSWEQLIMGGDFEGAKSTLGRGLSGPWIARCENVNGEWPWSLPGPLALPLYFATGHGNTGPVALDPFPSAERQEVDGDILPP
jgi:hypothetical protein